MMLENTVLSTNNGVYFSNDTKSVLCKSESSDNNLNNSELNEETKAKKNKPNSRYSFNSYKRSFVKMNKSDYSVNNMIKRESIDNNMIKLESSDNNLNNSELNEETKAKKSKPNSRYSFNSYKRSFVKMNKSVYSVNNMIKRESIDNNMIKLESSDNNLNNSELNEETKAKKSKPNSRYSFNSYKRSFVKMNKSVYSVNNMIKRESIDNNMIKLESSDNNLNNSELNEETKAKKSKPNSRYSFNSYKRSFVKMKTVNQSINYSHRRQFTATNKTNKNVHKPYYNIYGHREMRPLYNDNHVASPNHFMNIYANNTAPIKINDNPLNSTIAYKTDDYNESVNVFDNPQNNNKSESVQNNTVLTRNRDQNKQTIKLSIQHAAFITIQSTCSNQIKVLNKNGYVGKNDQIEPGSDIAMHKENSNYSTAALEDSNNLCIGVVSFNNIINDYTSKNVIIVNDNYKNNTNEIVPNETMLTGNISDQNKRKKLSICCVAHIDTCTKQCPPTAHAGVIQKCDTKASDQARYKHFLGDINTNDSVNIINQSQNSTTYKSENTILNGYNSDVNKQTKHLSICHVVYISIKSTKRRKRNYSNLALLKKSVDGIRQKYDQMEPTTEFVIHRTCLNDTTDQKTTKNLSVQRLTCVSITEKHRNRRAISYVNELQFCKRNTELSFYNNTAPASGIVIHKKDPDPNTLFETHNNFSCTNSQKNFDNSQNNATNGSIQNITMLTGIPSNNTYENQRAMASQHPFVSVDTRYNNRKVLLGNLKRDCNGSIHNILDKMEYSNANKNSDYASANNTSPTNNHIPTNNIELNVPNEIARKSSTHTINASMSKEKMPPKVSKSRLNRKNRIQKTRQSISKLFNHLRDKTQSTSQINIDNLVVDLDDTPNTVIHIDEHSEPRTSNIGQDSLIIIPDDNVKGQACSTPKSKGPLDHSTPRKKPSLDDLILAQSNNNLNLQSFNANLTKEINRSSFLTIDLTTETNKTEPTVIDLANTTDNEVTLVSVSNASSMSGDSDVTILKQPMSRKMRKFTHGIANLNASEKGKLLELITQTIFTGCTVPANLQRSLSNIQKDLPRTPDTAEDTYIKEVILGGKASRCSIGSNVYHPDRQKGNKNGPRMIVVDGSNVAMEHGRGQLFSVRGLQICIDYFLRRGHVVKAFVPRFRCKYGMSTDGRLLDFLERKGLVVYTPSREIKGRTVTPYDDRYILQCAAEFDGIVVSGDNYRDLIDENPRWRFVIENRLLPFTWVNDMIMFPKDPLGRSGPTLERFLRH